jgi:hypothetical protein
MTMSTGNLDLTDLGLLETHLTISSLAIFHHSLVPLCL